MFGFVPSDRITGFLMRVRAGSEVRNALDDCLVAGAFNQSEDDQLGREDIVL